MIGSILIKGLTMALGYVYPAYDCYKVVEKNKPEVEQLRFWCQYWILIAILTVCERVGDAFVSWIPMYGEAKLAFIIYLWYPKTMGATYVYDAFFRPYLSMHENDIDRKLAGLKARAGDITVLTWQRAMTYGQTRGFEILQYIASQSTPPRSAQPRPEIPSTRPTDPSLNHQDQETVKHPRNKEPRLPSPATEATQGLANVLEAAHPVPSAPPSSASASSENSYRHVPPEPHPSEIQEAALMDYEIIDSPPTEIMMEESKTLSSLRNRLSRAPGPKQY